MKRTLGRHVGSSTLLLMLALSTAAQANSGLTLYGSLNNGVEYIDGFPDKNGNRVHRFRSQSGDRGGSIIGLHGAEPLGNNTRLRFHLEQGLDTATGAANRNGGFTRWATVGVQHDRYGIISVGRMLWISNGVWGFDPFVQQAWSSGSLVRGRTWPKSSDSIHYQSPLRSGFDVTLHATLPIGFRHGLASSFASAADKPTAFNHATQIGYGRSMGAQLTFRHSPFKLRGIYDELRDIEGRFSDLFIYSREVIGALSVELGKVKFQAAYTHMWANDVMLPGAPTVAHHAWLGMTYRTSPDVSLTVGGFRVKANGTPLQGGGAATIVALGGIYELSKTTLIYMTAAQARNRSNARYGLGAVSVASADNPLPGHTQTGIYAGLHHNF